MKLKSPVSRRVPLIDVGLPKEYEEEGNPSWVEVRQSTAGDEMRLANEFSETSSLFDKDGNLIEQKRKWNGFQIIALRVYLTLAGANGIDLEDPYTPNSFKPAFSFAKSEGIMRLNMTESDFLAAWAKLPQPVTEAIYNAVLLENEQWNPNG